MNKNNNTKRIEMELTVEGIGETLKVTDSGALFIGNEYSDAQSHLDNNHPSIFLEDVSQVQNKELVSKLNELNKIVSEALTEVKELAVEAYRNDCSDAKSHLMVEGSLDEVKESEAP